MSYRVYIAGPMTGIEDFNYPKFREVEKFLRNEMGWEVENPANHFGGRQDLPYDIYIEQALMSLIPCDGIVVLDGWEYSDGAEVEIHVASVLGRFDFWDERGFEIPDPWEAIHGYCYP